MKHEMRLNAKPFKKIKDGEKTVELRLYDEKRRGISVGDIIVFTCRDSGERLEQRVKALHVFADFKQLYAALDLRKCGYAPQEIAAEGRKIWKNIIPRRSRSAAAWWA